MSTISLSISNLFQQVHGYKSPAFEFTPLPTMGNGANKATTTTQGGGPATSTLKQRADLGSAYYSVDEFGREYFMPVFLNDVELPYPVVSIEAQKIIVETPMVERRGTVKELINIDDYQIRIRGVIIEKNQKELPEKWLTKLRELHEQKQSLTLQCALTDIFLLTPERSGFDKVVIKRMRILEGRGDMRVRGYELELISDEIFDLTEIPSN